MREGQKKFMPELKHFYKMHITVELLRRRIVANFLEEQPQEHLLANLTPRLIGQLQIIRSLEPCSLQVLMQHLDISKSATSIAVEKLAGMGLVIRCRNENDRREVVICTAPEVRVALDELRNSFHDEFEENLSPCTEQDFHTIEEAAEIVLRMLSK